MGREDGQRTEGGCLGGLLFVLDRIELYLLDSLTGRSALGCPFVCWLQWFIVGLGLLEQWHGGGRGAQLVRGLRYGGGRYVLRRRRIRHIAINRCHEVTVESRLNRLKAQIQLQYGIAFT